MANLDKMDNVIFQKIKDALAQNEKVAIAVGKNPNLDDMAAATSLYLALKNNGKNVVIACPTDPLVEISSLVGIDKVKKSLSTAGGDLIVSFPYQEGEIEKVSYTLENGYLNIVVKAGTNGLSFSEKEIKYKHSGESPSLLFVIGTPRLSDLGNLFDPEALKNTTIINIDNKKENQSFGEIVLVSPWFSSVSEIVTNLIMSLGLEFDLDIAQNLLSGLSFATNNFQDEKTSATAFEMAAYLMKKGAIRRIFSHEKKSFQPDDFLLSPFEPNFSQEPATINHITQSIDRQFPKKSTSFPKRQQAQFFQPQTQTTQKSKSCHPPQKLGNDENAPNDWLTPKIYKGSTNV